MAIAPPSTRRLDIAVIGDLRLGADDAYAEQWLDYLRDVEPATLVLTGDVVEEAVVRAGRLRTVALRALLRLGDLAAGGTRVYILSDRPPTWLPSDGSLLHDNCAVRSELLLHQGGNKYYFGKAPAPARRRDRLRGLLRTRKTASPSESSPVRPGADRVDVGARLARERGCDTCVLVDGASALRAEVDGVRVVSPGSWSARREALELRFGEWTLRTPELESSLLLRRIVAAGPTVH